MIQRVIAGAHVKLYINGTVYNEVQELSYIIDYGEEPIYGIDSVFPQEIKVTRVSVQGSVKGVRTGDSNGLQGQDIRPGIRDSIYNPYISIRLTDRKTGEDIIWIASAKVTKETLTTSAKGITKLSFDWVGIQPEQPMDRF